MLKFKSFKTGEWTDEDIASFMNSHIVENSRALENGSIYFYYRDPSDIGMSTIDELERIDKAVVLAQRELFDAQQGLVEENINMAETEAKISETTPNDKEQWDSLQAALKFSKGQIVMHNGTIEERTKQVANLTKAAAEIKL